MDELETQRLYEGVTVEPTASDYHTAATEQHSDNDTDDHGGIALFRLFGGNRHFIHDFFSL